MTILLIHPPVTKPCEPPGGIAKLAGALKSHGIKHSVLDANLEGLLSLINRPLPTTDRWTTRAHRNRHRHLRALKERTTYHAPDRYRRAVADINRLVEVAASRQSIQLSLVNYQDRDLSPVRSADLRQAFHNPQANPFYGYFRGRLESLLDQKQPGMVGLSLNYLSQALCAFAMLGFIRRQWPQVTLILGGGLITSWARQPDWQNPFADLVDHLVVGPGEAELLALQGITGPLTGKSRHHRPDYTQFPLADYLAPGFILPYSASTGCYWNRCAFCPERAEGNPYKAVATEQVVVDLRELADQTQPVLIHLLDNAVSPTLMEALMEHPPQSGWYGFTRFSRHLADPVFCRALKQSGCVLLKVGLESGDQTVLDAEQKGIDLDLASRALQNLQAAGIAVYVYLLFGTPSESLREARATLDFTARHSAAIRFLNLAIFNLPIRGQQAQQLQTEMLYDGDLSLYAAFRHPRGWNRGRVRRFLDKEFKRHPAIRNILRRDPPLFTANHAPFFTRGLLI
jgi:radical SAM superfamily enzyme YgiQ (UPF0313 family)